MTDSTSLTLTLLRRELTNTDIPMPAAVDEQILQQAFRLSVRHDLAHMVGAALMRTGIGQDYPIAAQFKRRQIMAVYRYEHITYELNRMCASLEAAGIPHMLLKGAHLRRFYPAPEMRTSSDIDLLVKTEDLNRAVKLLTGEIGYTHIRRGAHDVLLLTPSGIHLELHYDLIEAEKYKAIREVLRNVWNSAVLLDGTAYGYTMSTEMLYFYHIAHMVKHFTEGGCGVRFFMDLWILEHRTPAFDREKLEAMLARCNLHTFAGAARGLAEVWFSGAPHDQLTQDMAQFVLSGGVYGSVENRVHLRRLENNRFRYLLSRIFLPYSTIKYQYPILQKHAWLLPFCEVHRWFRLLSKSTAKRIRYELNVNKFVSPESQAATRDLLSRLGL